MSSKNRIYFGACAADDCDRNAVSKGYCDKHYRRILKHGTLEPSRLVHEGNEIERFHQKYVRVPFSGCWIWIGGTRPNAQGHLYGRHHQDNGEGIGAHRFSWLIHNGPINNWLFVCHHCDTPLCVNPEHLFLGDAVANAADMLRKGRQPKDRGEDKKGRAKLTNAQATEIRTRSDMSLSQLAAEYRVSPTTISRVRNHVSY